MLRLNHQEPLSDCRSVRCRHWTQDAQSLSAKLILSRVSRYHPPDFLLVLPEQCTASHARSASKGPCLWALYPISPLLTTYPQGGTGRGQYRDKHRCGEPGQAMSLPVVSQGPTSSASPAPCPTAMECCTNTWEAGNPWGWPVSQWQVPLISFLMFNRFY